MKNFSHKSQNRTGAVATLMCLLLLPLLMLLALSVDYGFLLYIRTDLQRGGDLAALAAIRDIVPDDQGGQDIDQVRKTLGEFVVFNLGQGFTVEESDVQIGRYDPDTIYSNLTILDSGVFDTVQVTVRRDNLANSSVSLYFARLFGSDSADVAATATAVLQKASALGPGTSILPLSMSKSQWDSMSVGDRARIYGNGKMKDEQGNDVPGNFGTIDVGNPNNSTSDLRDQIENGLRQSDLDSLYDQGAIPSNNQIDAQQTMWLNADPGFSAGIKSSIMMAHGTKRLVPIFDQTSGGGGNNLNYRVIGWGVVELTNSKWQGSQNSYIEIEKSRMYDANLVGNPDLSDMSNVIDGAFTSPVLIN